jgi:hypothetical protein
MKEMLDFVQQFVVQLRYRFQVLVQPGRGRYG